MNVQLSLKYKKNFINTVLNLDSRVYPPEIQGTYASVKSRFDANKDSFILVFDKENLAGYICFFPISDQLVDIMIESDAIYDDDIEAKNILSSYNNSNVFIISLVVDPNFRNGECIKLLTDSFFNYINEKVRSGLNIKNIVAYSISNDGVKWLKNNNFSLIKKINNEEHLYIKSIKS